MAGKVLILGGRGRIGRSVAADLVAHTQAEITITGRTPNPKNQASEQLAAQLQFLVLDLADQSRLKAAIADQDLVIHCAGPFRQRDANVLKICIEEGVSYLDVSDDRTFTQKALTHLSAAQTAGVTAIINSGVFPGISNSMVRQGVEQLDVAEKIDLRYIVAGSGGAGVTVLRTTFLNVQHPFLAWIDNQWRPVKPYTERETIQFPEPYGRASVYWFDMPEAYTLTDSFPVRTVTTKFGSVPDFYNHLTWISAHYFPARFIQQPGVVEFLAQVGHRMTALTDRLSGIGVSVLAEIGGQKNGQSAHYRSTLVHDSAAGASGCGTGSLAELMLSNQVRKPGVWPVEQVLPTDLFEGAMQSRGIEIHQDWLPV